MGDHRTLEVEWRTVSGVNPFVSESAGVHPGESTFVAAFLVTELKAANRSVWEIPDVKIEIIIGDPLAERLTRDLLGR
jgi:hypothetical protein